MEELYYLEVENRILFFHEHKPEKIKGRPVLFLNPLFDEKKRSQKFYAETAREFCKHGIPVIRFDYYGTGDSEGQLFELDLSGQTMTIKTIIDKTLKKFQSEKINLLGLRFGADLAINFTAQNPGLIEGLTLIEPLVNGKRYLTEQRSRRKIFHRLNKMTDLSENIIINGNIFEDHQGYPISEKNITFLEKLNSVSTMMYDTHITLIKLNTISSRRSVIQLKDKLEEKNSVKYHKFNYDDFWANLEPIETVKLSKEIENMASSFKPQTS